MTHYTKNKTHSFFPNNINVIQCIRNYMIKMISNTKGVKVLLLDDYTRDVISVVMSQSEIMKYEVFLVGMLNDTKREKLSDLRCITFVRPSEANTKAICNEIINPKYQSYSLYFTNTLHVDKLDKIASHDKKELVKHVCEYFADYIAIDKTLFTLNISSIILPVGKYVSDRIADSLLAVLLSIKRGRPFLRYQKGSDVCKNIIEELSERIDGQKDLFHVPQSKAYKLRAPLLLLIDRRFDPVTPLLTQWTYQAMIHELCTINNNRVSICQKEIVTSIELDMFFEKHWSSNWGDLCEAVKDVVEEFKNQNHIQKAISSVDDIQQFMREFPQFKKFAGEVDKHVLLLQECRRQIRDRHLMDVSELEQNITCGIGSHVEHAERLKQLLNDDKINMNDSLRLVLIYAYKYDTVENELQFMKELLVSQKGCLTSELVSHALEYSPPEFRKKEPAPTTKFNFSLVNFAKKAMNAFHNNEQALNVFTQHKPKLHSVLELLFENELSEDVYPFCGLCSNNIPQDVIVFIIGGATYEEALSVQQLNTDNRSVVLGGTNILNSGLFLKDLLGYGDHHD